MKLVSHDMIKVYRTCDHCGCVLTDTDIRNSDICVTIRQGSDISFEWWSRGNYCRDCSYDLLMEIMDALPIPERHDSDFYDIETALAIEERLIIQRESREDY